ncbi:MAG: ABC transporter ATP-binding protein [Lentisphaerae bacterium]|nr:ABC transporter ATP-binding protein [Lentisphaerota bacterium]
MSLSVRHNTQARGQPLEFHYRSRNPFGTLIALAGRSGWFYLWPLTIFVLKQSPAWVIPILSAKAIDTLSDPARHSLHDLLMFGVFTLLLLAQNVPMHTYFIHLVSTTIRRMEQRLRMSLVIRLQQLSIGFHDKTETGRLQAKVLRDVEQIQTMSMYLCESGTMGVTTIVFALCLTAAKDPPMLLVYLALAPVAVFLIRFFKKSIRERNRDFRSNMESVSAEVAQMLDMIPVTRAHGLEGSAISRFRRQTDTLLQRGVHLDRLNATFVSSSWVTFQTTTILGLCITFWLCRAGRISVGDVVLYQGLLMQIVASISVFTNVYPQVAKGVESIRSIGEVLECPDIELNEGKQPVTRVEGAIEFERVEYSYPGTSIPALKGFSLRAAAGDCVALVGPSGAGKSTVMGLAIGFRRPTSGRILLDGADMQTLDMRQYRRFISVVPQQTYLFRGTIRENITFGLDAVDRRTLDEVVEMTHVSDFVRNLPEGLDTPVGEGGSTLSGGQRQRIAIARAMIRDPRLIIFDEATTALDAESENLVQDAIYRMIQGRTTFIVAHRLSTVRKAGKIVFLRAGQVVEQGSYDELMALGGDFFRMNELAG